MRLTNEEGYNKKDQIFFSKFQNRSYPGQKKNSIASWNQQGNLLVTAENSMKIWAFDQSNNLQLTSEARLPDSLNQIKFIGQNVLVGLNRESLKLWDIRQAIKPIRTQKRNKSDMLCLSWNKNPSTPQLSILCKDNTINLYDMRNNFNLSQPVHSIQKHKNDINEIQWDKTGSILFCAAVDGNSNIFMLYNHVFQLLEEIQSPHNGKINSIAVDDTNSYLASCADDSLTCLLSLPEVVCERVYSRTDCVMRKVAFSSGGDYLAASCEEPKIELIQNKGEQHKPENQEPCIDIFNVKQGGYGHRIKCGNVQQVLEWHPSKPVLAYFDYDESDKKRAGSQREQRYLHIYSM